MRFTESTLARRILQALLLLWAGCVILLYLVHYHHMLESLPLDIPRVAESLLTNLVLPVLWVLVFMAVGYGLGRAVLDLFRLSGALDTPEDDLLFSLATGWGLIGLGTLLLGSLGLLQVWLHIALAVAILTATHRQIVRFGKRLRACWSGLSDMSRFETFLAVMIGVIAIWGLPPAFVPEWGFDSLNSHLPAPAWYIAEGRITFHPEINFNNFPQTVEMWFLQSMLLLPRGASTPLMTACHLLVALTVFAMTRRFFGRGPALIATVLYLLVKKAYLFATMAYIDGGYTLMVVLGTYAVIRYIEERSRTTAVLAGLALGFACGIKYSAMVPVLILAVAALIFEVAGKRDFKRFAVDMCLAAGILILVSCAWYIRNWIWFHNPVFPFFSDVFPANGGVYAGLADDLKIGHKAMLSMFGLGDEGTMEQFLTLPVSTAFNPFGPYDQPGVGVFGPWFLMTLPLVIFLKRIPRALWAVAVIIVGTYAYWWFGEHMLHLRYMLPVFSLQAALAGVLAWEGLRLGNFRPRNAVHWTLLSIVFTILVTFFAGITMPAPVRAVFPILPEERERFMANQLGALPVVEQMNEFLASQASDGKPVSQVRVYGFYMEQYRRFCDFELIGNQVGYADHEDYMSRCTSAEDLHKWLSSYRCEYLIVNLPYAQDMMGVIAQIAAPGFRPEALKGWEEYFDLQFSLYYVYVFKLKQPTNE